MRTEFWVLLELTTTTAAIVECRRIELIKLSDSVWGSRLIEQRPWRTDTTHGSVELLSANTAFFECIWTIY